MIIKASELIYELTKDMKIARLPRIRHGKHLSIIAKIGMAYDGTFDVTLHTHGATSYGEHMTNIAEELEAAYVTTTNAYPEEAVTFRPKDTLVGITIKVVCLKSGGSTSLMRFAVSNRSGYEHAFTSLI